MDETVFLLLTQWNGRGERTPYGIYATLEKAQSVTLSDPVDGLVDSSWRQHAISLEWTRITYHKCHMPNDDDELYNVQWSIREMPVQK